MIKREYLLFIFSASVFIVYYSFSFAADDRRDKGVSAVNGAAIHDEGYGNDDAEYYNSEDNVMNVEDPLIPQEKFLPQR